MHVTALALADMSTMFNDNERARLGQIMHLTRRVMERHDRGQLAAASRAERRKMIDNFVRAGGLPERLALVAFLSAQLSAKPLAQASHARRLLQTIAQRWLAAVGRVHAQTPLKFRNPSLQASVIRQQRLNQRDQFFTGRNIWRFSDHPILESETASRVQENPLKIHATGKEPVQLPKT